MSYQLVVSEKPSTAQAYAKVLGATNRQDGYWEGNGYLVSWCIGHLVELAPPNVYDEKYVKWSVADLPILPEKWQYLVSASTKKQFGILKKLMNRPDVDSIVNSCDAGSEGLNLQFCSTIINYDLPWNPQKIEQRIGRCHRYGQTHDVVAINLLNTDNEADRRVYDILSKKFELFEGVFGASDVALGALESGVSFEKRILDIYQNCKNITAVRKAFAALNRQLDARKNAHAAELRSILLTESREAKGQALEKTKADIDKYLRDVEYWNQFEEPEVDHKLHYWKIDNWGEKIFGSHGVLFLGAFMDNTKLLFPVLLLCDENGEYINFTEDEIVSALEEANDSDVRYFKPTEEEQSYFHRIYARLISEVQDRHDKTVAPTIAYNKKKIENWANVQQEQLHVQLTDAQKEVEEYILAEMAATDTLEKKDIRKKAAEAKKKMDKLQNDLPKRRKEIQDEAQAEIDRFNQSQEINPLLLINIVLKF